MGLFGKGKSGDDQNAASAPPVAGPEQLSVPFVPQIRGGADESKQCAQQLNALIESMAAQGWRFDHLEDITTLRNNGCIASMAGNATSLVTYQVAIFEKR